MGMRSDVSEADYHGMHDASDDIDLYDGEGLWQTSDGRTLQIVNMTTSHLRNVIWYFEREGKAEHPKIQEIRDELQSRGRGEQ